jgi:hypothetical protein
MLQESLEKTRLLLDRQRSILGQRVARLHKINKLLAEACRDISRYRTVRHVWVRAVFWMIQVG